MTDVCDILPLTSSYQHANSFLDATHDSPYRTGRHVPLNQSRGGAFTSVATASESRADITLPYSDETVRHSTSAMDGGTTAYGGAGASPVLPSSPVNGRPYSPGLRSLHAQRSVAHDGFETHGATGEIQMQSFENGVPPPPPVSHSWKRIDAWADENYPELLDQLGEGCTSNDLNELEHLLDCSLPMDVRESLQVHDGQERLGMPTGIIFSSMLLDCEEMVQEWENWRKVNQEFLMDISVPKTSLPTKALGGSSSTASSSQAGPSNEAPAGHQTWKQDLMSRQDCVPPNAVQKVYSHPAWIPLVRDWGGNNLAVDLAPGPAGRWGQIILFGRDYDTKYVVARSWAALLAIVADDLNSGKWFVDEETNELKLREFKKARVEPAYFEILRWRMDQKYGRRAAAKRKSVVPGAAGAAVGAISPTGSGSPYSSPTEPNGDLRGRPLQRLSLNTPISSPVRSGYGKSSPLAQVAEEGGALEITIPNGLDTREKLVEVETPRPSGDENQTPRPTTLTNGDAGASMAKITAPPATLSAKANGKQPAAPDESMRNIEI